MMREYGHAAYFVVGLAPSLFSKTLQVTAWLFRETWVIALALLRCACLMQMLHTKPHWSGGRTCLPPVWLQIRRLGIPAGKDV